SKNNSSYFIALVGSSIISCAIFICWANFYQNKELIASISFVLIGIIFSVLNRVYVMQARVDKNLLKFAYHRVGYLILRVVLFVGLLAFGFTEIFAFACSFALSSVMVAIRPFVLSISTFFDIKN